MDQKPATSALSGAVSFLPPAGTGWRRVVLAAFFVLPLLYAAIGLWMGQNASWDFRNYHLYNAHAFLNDRYGRDLMPSQLQYFFNPLLDVPFYGLSTVLPPKVAYSVLAAVQGLNGILLFMICYVAGRDAAPVKDRTLQAVFLTVMGLGGAMAVSEIGMVYYDNVLSLGVFAAILLALRWQGVMTKPQAFLCGLPLGMVAGLKLPFAIFCVGAGAAFLLATPGDDRTKLRAALMAGLGVVAGLAVTYGFWGWKMWTAYGNPFFPHFNMLFQSPLMPDMTVVVDRRFFPNTIAELLFYPFVFALDPLRTEDQAYTDFRFAIVYALLLAIAAACLWRRYGRQQDFWPSGAGFTTRFLMVFVAGSYLAWLFYFCVYRYLLPVEMLAPLLVAVMLPLLPLTARAQRGVLAGVMVFLLLTTRGTDWGRLKQWSPDVTAVQTMLAADDKGLVLMAGEEAYSHLIPVLPQGLDYIRIESRFYKPDQMKQPFNDMVRSRIDVHKGPVRLLIPAQDYASVSMRGALAYFGLELTGGKCQRVTDPLYKPETYALCDLKRKS